MLVHRALLAVALRALPRLALTAIEA